MKKILFIFALLNLFTLKIYANSSYFIWHNTIIEVPLNANIEPYLDKPFATMSSGLIDRNLYYEKNGVNYTFISTINTSIKKTYYHQIRVHSPKYNRSSTQVITIHIVDEVAPTLLKGVDVEIPVYTKDFSLLDFIDYEDNYDSKADIQVILDTHGINFNQIGKYNVTVILKDLSLNTSYYEVTLTIKDFQKPVIRENENVVLHLGSYFEIDDYFVITDNYDLSPSIYTDDSKIDYNKPGIYPLIIEVMDQSNNVSIYETTVEIKDMVPPSITLKSNQIYLDIHETMDLSSLILKVTDNQETLPSESVKITTDLNSGIVGFYEAYYELVDDANNKTTVKVDIYVVDKEKPMFVISDITTKNPSEVDLLKDIEVIDKSQVMVHLMDTNFESKPGTYQALYLAIDTYGNHQYHLRHITILEPSNPGVSGIYIALLIITAGIGGISYMIYYYMKSRKKHNLDTY